MGQANDIMKRVPDLMQRIAGKSIPLEKFVARRARKFVSQGNRLALPGVELAYVLNCLGLSPRYVLFERHLDQVSHVLADLHAVKEPNSYGNGPDEYWDGQLRFFFSLSLSRLESRSFHLPSFWELTRLFSRQTTASHTSSEESFFDSSPIPNLT